MSRSAPAPSTPSSIRNSVPSAGGLLRNTPEYRDLVTRHEEFHREVAQIASMINHGKYGAARRAIDLNSNFRKASQAIANAITALDRIQPIAIAS